MYGTRLARPAPGHSGGKAVTKDPVGLGLRQIRTETKAIRSSCTLGECLSVAVADVGYSVSQPGTHPDGTFAGLHVTFVTTPSYRTAAGLKAT